MSVNLSKKNFIRMSWLLLIIVLVFFAGQKFIVNAEEEKTLTAEESIASTEVVVSTTSEVVLIVSEPEAEPEAQSSSGTPLTTFSDSEDSVAIIGEVSVAADDFENISLLKNQQDESGVQATATKKIIEQEEAVLILETSKDSSVMDLLRDVNVELWSRDNWKDSLREVVGLEMFAKEITFGFYDNIIFWHSDKQGVVAGMDIMSKACFFQTAEMNDETIVEYNYNKYSVSINNDILKINQVNEVDGIGL